MSSGTSIILNALEQVGAHSIASPANPESIIIGETTLVSMLESWLSEDIDLGIVPLEAPGDELGEPVDTTNAITSKLALLLVPYFPGLTVSSELIVNARKEFDTVKRLYQNLTIPDKVVSRPLPRGQGNMEERRSRVFSGKDATGTN